MKTLITIILFFVSTTCFAQERPDAKTLVVYGDTLFLKNITTGDSSQINKNVPSQTGQSGKVLSTNGTGYVWYDIVSALALKANLISPAFTTPALGVATGTSLAATGAISTTGTLGYTTGAGGTVTQTGTKATGVTINKISGAITTTNAALAAAAEVKFTVTNSTVAATDVPMVAIKSGGTSGSYLITVSAVGAGSFDIVISNASAGSLSEALVINFVILKAVSN